MAMRIIGERMKDDEAFIPMRRPRDLAALRRWIDGPSEEEMQKSRIEAAKKEEVRQAKMRSDKNRHLALVAAHELGVVASLLTSHAPWEGTAYDGKVYLECRGCPTHYDSEDGDTSAEWPCPTWTEIETLTP